MTKSPKVVIAAPLYNHAAYLPESIESLLSQTFRDFALILVDDCSSDQTPKVARRYAALDPRISYHCNKKRLGMIGNWRKAAELARKHYPESEYFAWGSDHDIWHPRWLASMVAELDRSPEVVLVYPHNQRISDKGEVVRGSFFFETVGIKSARKRLEHALASMSAGNMIYGLFRRRALEQAGTFSPVLLPDRLVLAELSLYGQFKQVPETLWYRRFVGLASIERQRAAFFPNGYPLYSYLPWWLLHTITFFLHLVVRGNGHTQVSRRQGIGLTFVYLRQALTVDITRRSRTITRDLHRLRKRYVVASTIFQKIGRVQSRLARRFGRTHSTL